MLLLDTALRIVESNSGAKFEDKIEAYQFLSDNWYLDRLSPQQHQEFGWFVESGLIQTAPWRSKKC